jgi:hypothetical protein
MATLQEAMDTVGEDRSLFLRSAAWPAWQALQLRANFNSPSINDVRGFGVRYALTPEEEAAIDWTGVTTAVWLAAIDAAA